MDRESLSPLAYSIAGASKATSLSESVLDAAIRAGALPVRRHGNRTLILTKELTKWLDSLPSGRAAASSKVNPQERKSNQ
jgi:hypothetical protein